MKLKFAAVLGISWLVLALALPALARPVPQSTPAGDTPAPPSPLRAWTIAADGSVFVLDADNAVHQLDPTNLATLAQSAPLALGAVSNEAPAHLLADTTHLFVASEAVSQTLVLDRADFKPVTTLRHAGPMALDPDRHLFMISRQTSQLLAYNPADLSQYPQGVEVYCIPLDLAVNPAGRRLYLHSVTSCGSSHHGEGYSVYNLDTLTQVNAVGVRENTYSVGRPVEIEGTNRGAGIRFPYASPPELITFDAQGQILTRQNLPLRGAILAASGDRFYMRHERGLAVMRVDDLSRQSFLPFTGPPPDDLALSPDGDMVYLFGPQVVVYPTAELQRLAVAALSPFPLAWLQEKIADKATVAHVYPSPEVTQDGLIFAQLLPYGSPFMSEIYRSEDGGRSWRAFPLLTTEVNALSLSPDFATDRTLMADFQRSTDGGETWTPRPLRLAFVSDRAGNREIYTANAEGGDLQRLTDDPAADEHPAWSPAWTRLAFQSSRTGNWDIFSLRAHCTPGQAGCDLRQLTNDPADDTLPAWSPDGRQIAFVSTRAGNPDIYVMDKDGQHQRRLTFDPGHDSHPAWLPDSQRLVFASDRGGSNDIYLLTVPPVEAAPLTVEPPLTPLVTGPADDRDPTIGFSRQLTPQYSTFSDVSHNPNGLLFFSSDRDGAQQTYITSPDGSDPTVAQLAQTDQVQASPSWFETMLLVAVGEASESDIYSFSSSGSPEALISSPGFDGQPAGGPVWWQPDASASFTWLLDRSAAAPAIVPTRALAPTPTATSTPAPQLAATPTATLTPTPTPLPPLTTTASITLPNLPLVGHLGGGMRAIFVHNKHIYLGMGPELVILDVTHPAQPARVGAVLLPQEVSDIEIVGDLAYVLAGGLRIFDVSDPAAPKEIGFYQTPEYTHGLTVVNNKVYLVAHEGLWIVDVSDPTAPAELGFCPITQVNSNDVVVRGDKAYVATASSVTFTGGLSIVDVSDPTRPGEVSRLRLDDLYNAWEVGLIDNQVYIGGSGGLFIVDAVDPTQPSQSGVVVKRTNTQQVTAAGVAVVNHSMYWTESGSGFHIADMTDPTQPVEVSLTPLSRGAGSIVVVDNYAYVVSGDGLHIFDVTSPATPRQAGQYLAPTGTLTQMAAQDQYLYLASTDSLNLIDVSQPASPVQVSSYYLPHDIRAVRAQGQFLYLAEEDFESGHTKGAIHVLDISNPMSLTEVSRYDLPGRAFSLVIAGHYAYVGSDGLLVLDISNPAALREVAYVETLPGKVAAMAGNYAYALGGDSGLHVLDISNPAAPVEVAVQPVRDLAAAAALAGPYVYLGERTFGFHVLDITDPTAPVEVSAVEDLADGRPFNVEGMAVAGDQLYLAVGAEGLHVFDISNPAQPAEIGVFNPPSSSFADEVVVQDGAVYLSDWSGGLYILSATP